MSCEKLSTAFLSLILRRNRLLITSFARNRVEKAKERKRDKKEEEGRSHKRAEPDTLRAADSASQAGSDVFVLEQAEEEEQKRHKRSCGPNEQKAP